MTGTHARFTGSIPENYDRYLGPFLFEPYAQDLVRRLDAKEGARVLEIACGTGIVTRRLREHLPPASALVATDLNPPMLEIARRKLGAVKGIDWRQADACALPFPDASFDAAVCQFGLMFVPDKPAACREARRVLVKGGTFLLSTWGALAQNPVGRIAYETVASFFPADPPDFYTVPFGLHQPEVVRGFLAAGGFTAWPGGAARRAFATRCFTRRGHGQGRRIGLHDRARQRSRPGQRRRPADGGGRKGIDSRRGCGHWLDSAGGGRRFLVPRERHDRI